MSWINDYQVWLSESQSLQNAQIVATHLSNKNWSKHAISALLGNMRHESSVNPNMYEYGYDWNADRGFGLVQWTPRSKYWNWALNNGYKESELRSGNAQLDRIDYEMTKGIQWISTPNYPESFKEFSKSTKDLSYLTNAFCWNYERPELNAGIESMPNRIAFANKCFNTLNFDKSDDSTTPTPPKRPDNKLPTDELDNWKDGIVNDLENWKSNFIENVKKKAKDLTTAHVHSLSHDQLFTNKFLKVEKTYNNTYKVSLTPNFLNELIDSVKIPDIKLPDITPKDPEPDPDPTPKPDTEINTIYLKPQRRLQQPYGRYFDNYGNKNGATHRGVDTRMNFEILKSVVKGEVVYVGWDPNGYGNYVKIRITSEIKEKGMYLLFAHLSKVSVKVGDKLIVGDTIGTTGNTGYWFDTTYYNGVYGKGEHLHVELQDKNHNAVDPTKFIWNNNSITKGKRIEYNIMTYLPSVMGSYDTWKDVDPTAWAIYYD